MMVDEKDKATITVRFIKSFQYRNIKHVVYKDLLLSQTVKEFIKFLIEDIKSKQGIPPPFRKHPFVFSKGFYYRHVKTQGRQKVSLCGNGLTLIHEFNQKEMPVNKTTDPVINRENDELILQPDNTLSHSGIVNETELSFFNLEEYREYQNKPSLVWE